MTTEKLKTLKDVLIPTEKEMIDFIMDTGVSRNELKEFIETLQSEIRQELGIKRIKALRKKADKIIRQFNKPLTEVENIKFWEIEAQIDILKEIFNISEGELK